MPHNDLHHLLETLPLRRLHALARGRIHRHFRLGKRRLIALLLELPADARMALETAIREHAPEPPRRQPQPRTPAQEPSHAPSDASTRREPPPPKEARQPAITESALLEGLGHPPASEFHADAWQIEAVDHLTRTDVIVSVPTGSGKTFVALTAMERALADEQTVIYTSPLKALSNTKYMEFSQRFGSDKVGILTGDRRENAQAPLLVMTTEILRNLLYDAASGEVDIRLNTLGLVILDETQYLADPERGVVWEETIIFCPAQARLLLLSASIGNPHDLAEWLTSIRPVPCHLVHHQNRSVPLRGAYVHPTGAFTPLFRQRDILQGRGYDLHPETSKLIRKYDDDTTHRRHRR